MNNLLRLLALSLLLLSNQAHAAKIELEFKGQKQVVEFNPADDADYKRAWNLWSKSDNRKYFVYSETGTFKIYDEPQDHAKVQEIGNWYQELDSMCQHSPEFANLTWDKSKWHPRTCNVTEPGWLKLDDPNLIFPEQLKPVKEWPIRYYAYYKGIDTLLESEGIEPKYDLYRRYQFDRDGYLLDNQTMKRKLLGENHLRMFHYRDFVKVTAVSPKELDVAVAKNGGMGFSFNLKQFLEMPKLEYSKEEDALSIWGSFDDPVKPVFDKKQGNACVMDCKNRKRWEP